MPRSIPLAVVAKWPTPNYENPETRGPAQKVVSVLLWVTGLTILALRLYTRRFISHGFGWDDVLISLAFIPTTAFSVVAIVAEVYIGWDRHIWDVRPDRIVTGLQLGLASFTLFDLSTGLTKLSVLALVYRMAADSNKLLKRIVIGLAILVIVKAIVFIFILFLQCRPISDYWNLRIGPKKCLDESVHLLVAGILNTVMDFVVIILPMGLVLTIKKLPRRQIIIVILLFGAGWVAGIAGIVRTYFTFMMTTSADFDITWHAWVTFLASSVELYVGIICVSIPATKPFFAKYLPIVLEPIATTMRSKHPPSDIEKGRRFPSSSSSKSLNSNSPDPYQLHLPMQGPMTAMSSPRPTIDLNKPLPKIQDAMSRDTTIRTTMDGEEFVIGERGTGTFILRKADRYSAHL